jgi:hypothetical protein
MPTDDRPLRAPLPPWAALALLILCALVPVSAGADVLESDILADSTIKLEETTTFGSYHTLTVTLETRSGQTTLTADKDGIVTKVVMPVAECLALWKAVLKADIEHLPHAPSGTQLPDQSVFTVSFSTARDKNTFSAYGVDTLTDTRYREIVREILYATDARAYGKTWRK